MSSANGFFLILKFIIQANKRNFLIDIHIYICIYIPIIYVGILEYVVFFTIITLTQLNKKFR